MKLLSSTEKAAEKMNEHFKSVFMITVEDLKDIPSMNSSTYAVTPDTSINVSGIHKLLSDLNPFKITGPDATSARFLHIYILIKNNVGPRTDPCGTPENNMAWSGIITINHQLLGSIPKK